MRPSPETLADKRVAEIREWASLTIGLSALADPGDYVALGMATLDVCDSYVLLLAYIRDLEARLAQLEKQDE